MEGLGSRERYAPGEAQVDFGEALVLISDVEQKAHYLAMNLPHWDDCFVVAFPVERGGKNAKRRAVVAVARKLAVLLHHLWSTGDVYQPLYGTTPAIQSA